MRRALTTITAACLIAAACSGDSSPATTTSAAPSTAVPTSAATTTVVTTTQTTVDSVTTTTQPATTTTMRSLDEVTLRLEEVASGFEQPVFLTARDGDPRLFVVDQPGRIWVIDDGDPEVFLDIREDVTFGGERGLLGLAFSPSSDDTFYVHYNGAGGATTIAEFAVSADRNRADPESRRTILTVDQPASNHNGGMIAFGPDGLLWIGLGDGGRANDVFNNGQDPRTLLGAMLRIDPSTDPYTVPADNPYADGGGAAEIWATGLRNPWRFAFDGDTLYIADVGQGNIEEIDVVAADLPGLNFGWPTQEGSNCFRQADCDPSGLVQPVLEYDHGEGCSVTGGFVYRGAAIPELAGHYFYSDFCSGFVRSFRLVDGMVADERDWTEQTGPVPNALSFGSDAQGELYVMTTDGTVYRIVEG